MQWGHAEPLEAFDVERAREDQRSIVRTWALRSTLHLAATEDLDWLLPLLGPVFMRANRPRRLQLRLDDATCIRGVHAIREVLAERGPQARAELVRALAVQSIRLEGQAAAHLICYAALGGAVCQGPDRGSEPAYVLLEDWIGGGRATPEDAALAALARRYLGAYGPAGPGDAAGEPGFAQASPLRSVVRLGKAGGPARAPPSAHTRHSRHALSGATGHENRSW